MTSLHDTEAIELLDKVIESIKPDKVVLLGDMLDLPDWSTHYLVKPEFTYTTQASIDWLSSWIHNIRPYCKDMIYIEGNHEKRMIDSIIKNTIQAYGIRPANEPEAPPLVSIPYLLGLHKMGVEYVGEYPKGEYYINNNLVCIHGNKVGAKSGQSVTKLLENARISIITGHTHRLEMAHKTIWTRGEPRFYQAATLGTLSRIDGIVPSGGARHNWQQGFGVVEYNDEIFNIETVGIYSGKCIYRGKLYEA
jgi:predicted phosphodiesterase